MSRHTNTCDVDILSNITAIPLRAGNQGYNPNSPAKFWGDTSTGWLWYSAMWEHLPGAKPNPPFCNVSAHSRGTCYGSVSAEVQLVPRHKSDDGLNADWKCASGSAATKAPWEGDATTPFLGDFLLISQCQAACEALPRCKAFVHAGQTPHVGPDGRNWAGRCYGRTDGQFPLYAQSDTVSGCNLKRDGGSACAKATETCTQSKLLSAGSLRAIVAPDQSITGLSACSADCTVDDSAIVENLLAPVPGNGSTLPLLIDLGAPSVAHHGTSCGADCLEYAAFGVRLSFKVSLQNGTAYSALVQDIALLDAKRESLSLALMLAVPARQDPAGAAGPSRAQSKQYTGDDLSAGAIGHFLMSESATAVCPECAKSNVESIALPMVTMAQPFEMWTTATR